MKVKVFCVLGIIMIIILGNLIIKNCDFDLEISNEEINDNIADESSESEDESDIDTVVHVRNGNGYIIINTKNPEGELIQGVRYNIYDANNEYLAKVVANESGIAKIDGLEYGTYYIKVDYLEMCYNYDVEKVVQINVTEDKPGQKYINQVSYVSYSSIEATIKDSNNLPVKGISIKIYYENNNSIFLYKTIETDENGIATLEHLPAGSYDVKITDEEGETVATAEFEETNETATKHTIEYVLKDE